MPTPKKSIEELKANGTYRPSRHEIENPIELPVEAPVPPKWLSKTAVKYFNEITEHMTNMNTVAKADQLIISFLSSEIADWVKLNRLLKREGMFITQTLGSGEKKQVTHPALLLADSKLKTILGMLDKIGFTPAARSRLSANETAAQEKSLLGQFLSGNNK